MSTNFNFSVRLDNAVQGGFQLGFDVIDGTATASDDFEILTISPLVFEGHASESQSIAVRLNGDSKVEADETFQVALGAVSGLAGIDSSYLTIGTSVSGVILNDDSSELTIADVAQDEDAGEMTFTVTLGNAVQGGLTIDYQTADGTAQDGDLDEEDNDYARTTGTLTFAGSENEQQTFSVPITPEISYENEETFLVSLANLGIAPDLPGGTGQTIDFGDTAIGTILNDDVPNALIIRDATQAEGDSGSAALLFTVEMSSASTIPVSVGFHTTEDTANGSGGERDFVAINSGTLTFAPGEIVQTITVDIVGDETPEVDETFFVELFNPTNGVILDGQAIGTIVNDDGAPVLASINDLALNEGDGGITTFDFLVTLSQASTEIITLDYETFDGTANGRGSSPDYERLAHGTLTFAPGETTRQISVDVYGDEEAELDESFFVNLTNPTNVVIEDAQGEGRILNDDASPTFVSVDDVELMEGDTGITEFAFTVSLSEPNLEPVSVNFETIDGTAVGVGNANDYSRINQGSLTFAPGETTKTVVVEVIGDTQSETDESFILRLSNPTNAVIADGEGVGRIGNDDAPPIFISIADVAQYEGNAGSTIFEFTVTLSAASTQTIRVDFTTADGSASSKGNVRDYERITNGRLVFAAGETQKTISVVVHGDSDSEPNETFFVNLSNATDAIFADNQALGEILDDDVLP